MFRVSQTSGIGNILIYLSQLDDKTPVSRKCLEAGYRGKYLEFTNLNIVEESEAPDIETPPIYINSYTATHVHPKCVHKVRPSSILSEELSRYPSTFTVGLAIRLGGMNSVDYPQVADKKALDTFCSIIESENGPIFLAVDSLEYKRELDSKYKGKLFFIDKPLVVADSNNTVDDSLPFLEFFLLSKCNKVYVTGGKKNFSCFSTFGYMAAIYGSRLISIVWNDK
jgi:hypothetical protein